MKARIKIELSSHALDRAHEIGLSKDEALRYFAQSQRYYLSFKHHKWKKEKYGFTYRGIEYYSYKPLDLIFTARRLAKRIVCIVTITKKIYDKDGQHTVIRGSDSLATAN